MFEDARIILGSFPKTVLMEDDRYRIETVKKVSKCHYRIIDKYASRKSVYKKMSTFEKALRKNNIDKDALKQNISKKVNELLESLNQGVITKDTVDFFAIKKALFKPNEELVLESTEIRKLILKNKEDKNYYEMLFYTKRNNRKVLTARVEVGCIEIVKTADKENMDIKKVVNVLKNELKERYKKVLESQGE